MRLGDDASTMVQVRRINLPDASSQTTGQRPSGVLGLRGHQVTVLARIHL